MEIVLGEKQILERTEIVKKILGELEYYRRQAETQTDRDQLQMMLILGLPSVVSDAYENNMAYHERFVAEYIRTVKTIIAKL